MLFKFSITTVTFHTSPVSPSPISPKAETSCWLVSGEEKWWLCKFLGSEEGRVSGGLNKEVNLLVVRCSSLSF